ncbi:transporter substrate-binding domain-containing protein [Shimia sp. R11_0]|uniref:substrate-binding periplasmic protein n=1 Tax=Shimia sp. R11_0 TaxID=2821096 RepID=UPI001ADB52E4|nr:transporter substrate-binding domain-containing protein [Shimia sp. R11_0]MBO9479516.1 transporter substrate-binding domain-containing protein [Shimia sp. R11_0]
MFTRLFSAAALACATAATTLSAAPIKLVQDEAYAPYMGLENGTATGIWADFIAEAMTRIEGDFEVVVEAVPWSRAVNLVESGQAHGLIGTYYRPDARPWIGTYSTSPVTEKVSVYCREGVAQSDWSYPEDFKGLTFGNNAGFGTPGKAFFDMVAGGLVTLQEAQTTKQNLMKLEKGRIDCYVQEQLAAEIVINENNFSNVVRVLDASAETAHIGFRADWQDDESQKFIEAFNAALQSMMDDGTVEKIVARTIGG